MMPLLEKNKSIQKPPDKLSIMAWSILILVCLGLFFFKLGSAPIFDLDEGLYATCSRVMSDSNNWITPFLNSMVPGKHPLVKVPFFEKPIFIYWIGAASIRLFGTNPWAVRFPVAIISLVTTLLIAQTGSRWFGARAGFLAGLVYATSPLTILDARQFTTDCPVTLFFTLQMLSFFYALEAYMVGNYSRMRWMAIGFWLTSALAILTKGAVGLILPPIAFGVYLLVRSLHIKLGNSNGNGSAFLFAIKLRPLKSLREGCVALWPLAGILLCLIITVPWHYLIWKAGGRDELGLTWVQEYIIRQHIGRFRGLDKVHDAPFFTYFIYFAVFFLPWAGFAPAAFRTYAKSSDRNWEHEKYLQCWFWTIFVCFSIAAAKLPTYIAPAFPAAAILLGRWLDTALSVNISKEVARSLKKGAEFTLGTSLFLLVAVIIAPHLVPKNAPLYPNLVTNLQFLLVFMNAGIVIGYIFFRNKGNAAHLKGVAVFASTLLFSTIIGCAVMYPILGRDVLGPYQLMAKDADSDAKQGIPIVYYHIIPRRPSMNFYSNYSPYENKNVTLYRWMRAFPVPSPGPVDIVTSMHTYRMDVIPRSDKLGIKPEILDEKGGWVLLRVNIPATQKIHEMVQSNS